jgi:DNA polymerase alpha-associated DNA helicase A
MQLPPTILSTNKERKKDLDKSGAKASAKAKPQAKASVIVHQKQQALTNICGRGSSSGNSESATSDDEEDVTNGGVRIEENLKENRKPLKPPRTLETTLFDRLEKMYGPGIKRMLNVQYR